MKGVIVVFQFLVNMMVFKGVVIMEKDEIYYM